MIRFDDFLSQLALSEYGSTEEKLNWLFTLHDIDGNGSIDKFELLEIVRVSDFIFFTKAKIDSYFHQYA